MRAHSWHNHSERFYYLNLILFIGIFKFVEHEKESMRCFILKLMNTLKFIVEISTNFSRMQTAFFCTLSVFLKESTVEDFPSKLFSKTTELICSALFHIKYGYILLSSTKSSSLFSFKQLNPFHVKKDIIFKIYAIFIQFHLFNFHYHCSSVLVFLFYQK